MKRIIFLIAVFTSLFQLSNANERFKFDESGYSLPKLAANHQEYTFKAGDTSAVFSVNGATAVFFTGVDSAMAGTDSLYLAIRNVSANGVVTYTVFAVHLLATTTQTTFIASSLLIPGASTTGTWVWYPGGPQGTYSKWTGQFYMARLNGVNAATPYLPVTHIYVDND